MHGLNAILEAAGWIDPENYPVIADVFNISIADVRGLASFYEDFKSQPPKLHTIRLCQAEACQALGARQLRQSLTDQLQNNPVSESCDVGEVYCLGLCPLGPAAMVNKKLIARATPELILATL